VGIDIMFLLLIGHSTGSSGLECYFVWGLATLFGACYLCGGLANS